MPRSLALPLVLVLAVPAAVAQDPDEKAKRRAQATRDGVRDLLESAWNSPSDKIKQTGGNILTRYRKKEADPIELQFAYGLVLARHGEWEAAEANFRKVSEKVDANADVWLALCHVHLRTKKFSSSLDDVRRAWHADDQDPRVVETLATLVTFLSAKPPPKFRPEEARKMEDEIYPRLPEPLQTVFKAARERTKHYIDALPALRQELLKPVQALREESEKARKKAREQELDVNAKQAEGNRRLAQIQRIEASATEDAVRLDRLIQAALARGDTARAQAYQAEKVALLQAAQAQADVERARLNETRIELQMAQEALRDLVGRAEQLAREVAESEAAIDLQLSAPPPIWDASSERDRLLDAGSVGLRPEKPDKGEAPKSPRTDEDRARALMQIADSLRASGLPELARRYFERVVAEFPETRAAKDAAWELEQGKASPKPPEEKPKGKKGRTTRSAS